MLLSPLILSWLPFSTRCLCVPESGAPAPCCLPLSTSTSTCDIQGTGLALGTSPQWRVRAWCVPRTGAMAPSSGLTFLPGTPWTSCKGDGCFVPSSPQRNITFTLNGEGTFTEFPGCARLWGSGQGWQKSGHKDPWSNIMVTEACRRQHMSRSRAGQPCAWPHRPQAGV